MESRYESKVELIGNRILHAVGAVDPSLRQSAASGTRLPDDIAQEYVQKIWRNAYKITDDDIDALERAGYSEDQIFELSIAAAYGAARSRLDAALRAMGP